MCTILGKSRGNYIIVLNKPDGTDEMKRDTMKKGLCAGAFFLLLLLTISTPVSAECISCSGYTITATYSDGGLMEPSGLVAVAPGENQTFLMTPDPKDLDCWGSGKIYVLWNYVIDGVNISLGPDYPSEPVTYTFTDVQSNHSIHADFTYAIVDARPMATFMANATNGTAPLAVAFSQDQVSNNTGVMWSFGDGMTSTEPNPVHTYTGAGIYDVIFTISCDNLSYAGNPLQISVFGPPAADFTANRTSGIPPLVVQFTDSSSGALPLDYLWDFGDGLTSTEQNPVHTYENNGLYTVNLTVGNDYGTDTKTYGEPIIAMGTIGGDKGYYLVHCNIDGANVYFDDMFMGVIEDGTLLVPVYTTATPFFTYTVQQQGYETFTAPISSYPGKGQTIDLFAELTPFAGFYVPLGDGWNLFSTPVTLDSQHDRLTEIFTGTDRENITVALAWNGIWFIPDESYTLRPLDAVYIRVNGESYAALMPSSLITAPPSRSLASGLSLIGPAPSYTDHEFTAMPLDVALISINEIPGGGTGYTMVISPGMNQPGWAYARGGSIQDLEPYKGYWVIMENPDTLYGFSTTPLNL
jgi:PKD repeat protein